MGLDTAEWRRGRPEGTGRSQLLLVASYAVGIIIVQNDCQINIFLGKAFCPVAFFWLYPGDFARNEGHGVASYP
ncbi:MAG: hypothetical protein C7B46_01260 [Sulfobacillus benefaciens]|uniref:Uncharacterized protein n=1 Tax=Sulfobacillus benefaciens TaxID=453960 RepID=A0A2T2XLE8_9FIRM|nr:MAG: hypothetical protein C7B46_01260 [Sulfobacillus benefaciens]